jgi:hypothetical protein
LTQCILLGGDRLPRMQLEFINNQMSAKGFNSKPIIALPLYVFKGVKKSKFTIPDKGKNTKLIKVLNRNQFELLYKEEILDVIMRNFLKEKIINDDTQETEQIDLDEKLNILKSNLTSSECFKVNATMGSLNNSSTWSNREGEWFCAEKRFLFSSQRSKDLE